ncbi:MAG: hypothetical protein R2697_02520 [Ilumatobacteraceae bacterium]
MRVFDLTGPGPFAFTLAVDQSPDRAVFRGLATIDGACATAGEAFRFHMTVLGYDGVPGETRHVGADDPVRPAGRRQ